MEIYTPITALIVVVVVFGGTICGILLTKKPGFGRYTTSVLIFALVLFVASLAFVLGKVELEPLSNLLFAIAGFAGGLIMGKQTE